MLAIVDLVFRFISHLYSHSPVTFIGRERDWRIPSIRSDLVSASPSRLSSIVRRTGTGARTRSTGGGGTYPAGPWYRHKHHRRSGDQDQDRLWIRSTSRFWYSSCQKKAGGRYARLVPITCACWRGRSPSSAPKYRLNRDRFPAVLASGCGYL
jgi:hypothetical protein